MMRLFLALFLMILSSLDVKAQIDFPDSPGWELEQHCLGELPYPTIPQTEWTFEGVIFSRNSEGIRAIRTDFDTSYFVALDSDSSFALDGVFSPDGRWFAYAKGVTQYNNMISNLIGIRELSVVGTDPQHQVFTISWRANTFTGSSRNIPPIQWLDNEQILLPEGSIGEHVGTAIVNPFSGEVQAWEYTIDPYLLYAFSPDASQAIYRNWHDDTQLVSLYNVEDDKLIPLETSDKSIRMGSTIEWLPESSGFIGSISYINLQSNVSGTALVIFDRQGNIKDVISKAERFRSLAISSDGSKLAFTSDNQLFIAYMKNAIVTDLCFTMSGTQLAWSPDNIHLAFTYGGYPIILNTLTQEMQILRYETYDILGWYPIEES